MRVFNLFMSRAHGLTVSLVLLGMVAMPTAAEEANAQKLIENIKHQIDGYDAESSNDQAYYEMGQRQGTVVGKRLADTLDCGNLDIVSSSYVEFDGGQRQSYLYGYYRAFTNELEKARFKTLARCLDEERPERPEDQIKQYQRLHQSVQKALNTYAVDSCDWQRNRTLSCQIEQDFWLQTEPAQARVLFFQNETITAYNQAGSQLFDYEERRRIRSNQDIQRDIMSIVRQTVLSDADIQRLQSLSNRLQMQGSSRDAYLFSIQP